MLANTFLINKGKVVGVDRTNPMSQDQGKIKVVQELNINSESIMIGDGFTDYEVFLNNASKHFIYFSENVFRKEVASRSNHIANSFEEVLNIISKI